MDIDTWAKKEIEIACRRERSSEGGDPDSTEWDYGVACYKSAYKAYNSLCQDGHSGTSIQFTKNILMRLIDGKPLTPIYDVDDVWEDISRYDPDNPIKKYQCKRMSSLFKDVHPDGSTTYTDVDRFVGIDINSDCSYHSGLVDSVMKDYFPIKMPYNPSSKAYRVYCEDFLFDPQNGDYDTVAILYCQLPDGNRMEVNKFFKEAETGFVEISMNEYTHRKNNKKNTEIIFSKEENNGSSI